MHDKNRGSSKIDERKFCVCEITKQTFVSWESARPIKESNVSRTTKEIESEEGCGTKVLVVASSHAPQYSV